MDIFAMFIFQAYPLLSFEEARSHVVNVLSVYGGDPKGEHCLFEGPPVPLGLPHR